MYIFRAIWLAENQSRPLPVFTVETEESGERVMRCCLLPQRKYIQPPDSGWSGSLSRHLNIKFDQSQAEPDSVVTITENSAVKTGSRSSVKSHGI